MFTCNGVNISRLSFRKIPLLKVTIPRGQCWVPAKLICWKYMSGRLVAIASIERKKNKRSTAYHTEKLKLSYWSRLGNHRSYNLEGTVRIWSDLNHSLVDELVELEVINHDSIDLELKTERFQDFFGSIHPSTGQAQRSYITDVFPGYF